MDVFLSSLVRWFIRNRAGSSQKLLRLWRLWFSNCISKQMIHRVVGDNKVYSEVYLHCRLLKWGRYNCVNLLSVLALGRMKSMGFQAILFAQLHASLSIQNDDNSERQFACHGAFRTIESYISLNPKVYVLGKASHMWTKCAIATHVDRFHGWCACAIVRGLRRAGWASKWAGYLPFLFIGHLKLWFIINATGYAVSNGSIHSERDLVHHFSSILSSQPNMWYSTHIWQGVLGKA